MLYICVVIEPNSKPMKTRMTAAEGSKFLKQTLQKEFPGTKFSVKMSRGTAYGYVDVRYEDGPAYEDVERIANGFEGLSFDGSIDMAYSKETSYCPVHGAMFAGTRGTSGSRGYVTPTGVDGLDEPYVLCCEKAALVDFGLRMVHVERKLSIEAEAFLVDCHNTRHGHEDVRQVVIESTYDGKPYKYTRLERVDCPHHNHHDLGYEFREFLRKADLRDPAKLMREAKAYRAEKLAYWKAEDEKMKAETLAKVKEEAAAEVRGEQKEFKLQYLRWAKPNLN